MARPHSGIHPALLPIFIPVFCVMMVAYMFAPDWVEREFMAPRNGY